MRRGEKKRAFRLASRFLSEARILASLFKKARKRAFVNSKSEKASFFAKKARFYLAFFRFFKKSEKRLAFSRFLKKRAFFAFSRFFKNFLKFYMNFFDYLGVK